MWRLRITRFFAKVTKPRSLCQLRIYLMTTKHSWLSAFWMAGSQAAAPLHHFWINLFESKLSISIVGCSPSTIGCYAEVGPCQRSTVPNSGSIWPLPPVSIWEKNRSSKLIPMDVSMDISMKISGFSFSHWIPLASSTSTSRPGGVDGVLRQFYQDLDDLFHADSVGNGRGQGEGCDLIFLGPGMGRWKSLAYYVLTKAISPGSGMDQSMC